MKNNITCTTYCNNRINNLYTPKTCFFMYTTVNTLYKGGGGGGGAAAAAADDDDKHILKESSTTNNICRKCEKLGRVITPTVTIK